MIAGDTSEPLFADWEAWLRDPASEWGALWQIVAGRAQSLVDDFPTAAAMVKAKLLRIHGPHGLRFRSLFQSDDQPDTTDAEIQKRREIEMAIKRGSADIDAGGMLSRAELDWCISYNATVLGDGFAVRVWQPIPGVKTSTRWRIVHPARVCAPPDKMTDPKYAGGIEIDGNGRPSALWVVESKGADGYDAKPTRIPWFATDGTRNVVHKVGLRRPGSRRGLSEFAPIMLPARMLQGVDIAYVTMKRVQASHPMLIKVDDLKAAREQYRGTRIGNLLIGKGHEVTLPPFKFEGADYREFVDTTLRGICAAWQLPWELVLGDHSARSGAASRSLWQQHYQMAEREQAQHVEPAQGPIDESLLREAAAVGAIALTDDWQRNTQGVYQGPPKVMPDPQKEIEWATQAVALGMSKSTVFARMGEDYRDERMQSRQDSALDSAQTTDEQFIQRVADIAKGVEASGVDGLAWPIVLAAGAANTAPGAFLDALAKQGGATAQPQPATSPAPADGDDDSAAPADHAEPMDDDEHTAAVAAHGAAPSFRRDRPHHTINVTMPPMTINIPKQESPQVTVNATMPVPSVTIEPAQVHVAGASVINEITTPAPVVTVQAAAAQQAPTVTVNVSPTPVTIDNVVEVPQRAVRAVPQSDGSTLIRPVEK